MTLFTLSLNDKRKNQFEYIENIPEYVKLPRSEIIDLGLQMIINASKEPQRPQIQGEPVDFFMLEDDIYKYVEDNKESEKLDLKIKQWVRIFNALNTMNKT